MSVSVHARVIVLAIALGLGMSLHACDLGSAPTSDHIPPREGDPTAAVVGDEDRERRDTETASPIDAVSQLGPCGLAADRWALDVQIDRAACEVVVNARTDRVRVGNTVRATLRWADSSGETVTVDLVDSVCRVRHAGCVLPLERTALGWLVAGPCAILDGESLATLRAHRALVGRHSDDVNVSMEVRALADVLGVPPVLSEDARTLAIRALGPNGRRITRLLAGADPLQGVLVDVSRDEFRGVVTGVHGVVNHVASANFEVCGCRDERLQDDSYLAACAGAWDLYLETRE